MNAIDNTISQSGKNARQLVAVEKHLTAKIEALTLASFRPIFDSQYQKGHIMSQSPFISIAVCNSLNEAHIMKGVLEQNAIPAIIEDHNFSSIYPTTNGNGVHLKIHEGDLEKANVILANISAIAKPNSIIPNNNEELEECPACGSPDIFKYKSFFGWTLGKTKPNVKGDYRACTVCDHRWRAVGDRQSNMLIVATLLGLCAYGIVWGLLSLITFLRTLYYY